MKNLLVGSKLGWEWVVIVYFKDIMCSVPIWLENRTYFLPESSQFALPSSQGAVGQANEVLIPFLTKWNWLDEIKPHKFDILNLVNQTSRFKIRFIINSSSLHWSVLDLF